MANWNKLGSRGSIDDRRASPMRVGGIGLAGTALLAFVGYLMTGTVDLGPLVTEVINTQTTEQTTGDTAQFEGADEYEVFASTVLGSTNEVWNKEFATIGKDYVSPNFVLFRAGTESACGGAYSEYGPHYCPTDQTVYLDETFFDELRDRFGAEGDVAQAYVMAHEVGHHVQTLLGFESSSVEFELQADCLAGVWANSVKDAGVFETGEIKEALDAASAVGDDNIQKSTTGRVNPETWTHGSSEQRVSAFTAGYEGGSLQNCTR